jgi:cytochrome c oxidase cbb3-type subunit 3
MDDEWIYGSSAANVFWTIMEGRPQGMPAYGGRIVEDQAWRIAAYVRSLSGLPKQNAEEEKNARDTKMPQTGQQRTREAK